MKKTLFCILPLLGLFLGCESNSTSSQESEAPQPRVDTLVVMDTVHLSRTDTVVISKKDTLVVSKTDSVVVSKIDTMVVSKQDTVVLSKTDTIVVTDTVLTPAADTGTGILDFYPDAVMIPILGNLTHQKRDANFTLREKQIVLLHFTDIHGHEENLRRIKEFYDHYSKYIDIVIHSGDALYDKWYNSFDFWDNAGAEKFLNVLGNHDVNFVDKDGNPIEVTQKEVYDRFFAPYLSSWNVITPQNAAENGLMYYYKDINKGTDKERAKLRLVVLDEYHWDDAQIEWLQEVLDDALTNDFAVVISRHESFPINKYENCPFVSMETFKCTRPMTEAQIAVNDFMGKGGEFVAWLGGHHHQDDIGTLQDYPHQIAFNGDVASMNHIGWSDSWRKMGTRSQDCFTLIGIDRFEKVIRFVRIGADTDRYERSKKSMSINYSTAKMIYSD